MINAGYKTKGELLEYLQSHPIITDSKLVNDSVLWVIQTHSGGSFLSGFELVEEKGLWRHSPNSEGSTPPWLHCPIEFLDKTPTTNEEWRKKVVAAQSRVRSRVV